MIWESPGPGSGSGPGSSGTAWYTFCALLAPGCSVALLLLCTGPAWQCLTVNALKPHVAGLCVGLAKDEWARLSWSREYLLKDHATAHERMQQDANATNTAQSFIAATDRYWIGLTWRFQAGSNGACQILVSVCIRAPPWR